AGDADARTADDRFVAARRPQAEGRLVHPHAVVLAADAERLADATGAGAEQPPAARCVERDATPARHHGEPFERLDRADQHPGAVPRLAADDVEAPVDAVRAVDVDVA